MMRPAFAFASREWQDANLRDLTARLGWLRALLLRALGQEAVPGELPDLDRTGAFPELAALFGLTPFEGHLLMLCAGAEMDSGIAALCAEMNGDPRHATPTFGMALTLLPDAHWSALSPGAPLRRWRLVTESPAELLTRAPLTVDERILHVLAGVDAPDPQLAGFATRLPSAAEPLITPLHQRLADLIISDSPVVVALNGPDRAALREAASAAASLAGVTLLAARARDLPALPQERAVLAVLCARELHLTGGALLMEADGDASHLSALAAFIGELDSPVMLTGDAPVTLHAARRVLQITVDRPTAGDQRLAWARALAAQGLSVNGAVSRLSAHFQMSPARMRAAVDEAISSAEVGLDEHTLAERLWEACRRQAQTSMNELAQRIETRRTWDDLVLPAAQLDLLRAIVMHVEQRHTVYEDWGYGAAVRGTGASVIFAGPSGTGKTLAAEIVANVLQLDLYRIDLSGIVSKYIGETEKNLRRIFNAAEQGGAILLFDEADALFGKRSEVRDSHDRYANIEVSYLLQQMEAYHGLAVLTTNMLDHFDRAFLRRVRFIVQFPFPSIEQRFAIWQRAFPSGAPTSRLDLAKLARLNVTGGHIHNIALNAAFLAAGAGEPIRMKHLLSAATSEYAKLEKPLPDSLVADWVRRDG